MTNASPGSWIRQAFHNIACIWPESDEDGWRGNSSKIMCAASEFRTSCKLVEAKILLKGTLYLW